MHPPGARLRTLVVVGAALVLVAGACGSSDDDESTAGTGSLSTTSTGDPTDTTARGPGTTLPAAPAEDASGDQTPPVGTNGLVVDPGGTLWLADGEGNQILAVDLSSGEILRRFPAPDGAWPDDVAFDEAGRVFWTGFEGGQVGRIDPDTGEHVVVAQVGPGANPITLADDGRLLVGRALTAEGLFAVDPDGSDAPVEVAATIGNVNAFDVAADGLLYGPRAPTDVVAVDPATGTVSDVVAAAPGFTAAIREAPESTVDAVVLLVLSVTPTPAVHTLDVASGTFTELVSLDAAAVDNLAVTGDGTIVVSTFNTPELVVRAPDGALRTVTVGRPPG